MLLLILFALIAGAATAVTPCVLPVLPALLSASAAGGRRRPLGIVLGLTATFTFSIVALASVIDGVGLNDGVTRTLAVVVLIAVGVVMLLPAVSDRLEAFLSRLAPARGPAAGGEGFWSGALLGGALGFVYAPCAGPLLAAVVSIGATQGTSLKLALIGLAYAVGNAGVLLVLALGGRRVLDRVRRAGRGVALQRGLATVMVATGVALATDLDIRLESAIAQHFPAAFSNPTKALEETHAVSSRLAELRGKAKFAPQRPTRSRRGGSGPPVASDLPVLGTAPEFTDTQRWFNAPADGLRIQGLRGRVVLIDFWTYTCINCLRTLPHVKAWDARYRRDGLTIVGVHTPEFPFERIASNVDEAIHRLGIRYPVVQDNRYGTWDAWGNQYWPAKYLIDARGRVRYAHFGEGEYGATEDAIRSLLREAGARRLGRSSDVRGAEPSAQATPETYLDARRAERFLPSALKPGTAGYEGVPAAELPLSHFSLDGGWSVSASDGATALRGASIAVHFAARDVFLVLSPGAGASTVRVELNGRPISRAVAGADVRDGAVRVTEQRLYRLVHLPRYGEGALTLRLSPGISAFAFTFG
jgi:cytochrome c biogenesis protein CcdA/thiol-disulfide isomerase/thioredoxin